MFVQTLPNMVQARILSFLAVERQRFCRRDLRRLARDVLSGNDGLDFWVEKAARNLFDTLSESDYKWISGLSLDSGEETAEDEFESVPSWLMESLGSAGNWLPWLPILDEDLMNLRTLYGNSGKNEDVLDQIGEDAEELMDEVMDEVEIDHPINDSLGPEIQNKAANLKAQIMNFDSASKTVDLANEIRELCSKNGGDSLMILGLIEPWLVDDEIASVLLSHLSNGSEEELKWPSQVLCSIVLPKLLALEEPAPRVLLTATIEYCKLHQRAAEYALLLPLILRKDGINNPICDVIIRIVKECFHPAHISAFFQKLLCGDNDERRVICQPCHQHLISDQIVWTESVFGLLQNILIHYVCFTQDSVDHIVYQVQHSAGKFPKSLKFGNFLLCLVTKCSPLLKSHRRVLTEAVERTNTLVTKSILYKLSAM